MAPNRPPRPETGTIAGVLANLRRAPKRVRRQSREVVENAVSQLFDAAVRYPHGALGSGEYRIEDLARLAGTTTRNIRVYRDRGLLPPPLRVGRIALFNDTHLTRLRLITSMLDRGNALAGDQGSFERLLALQVIRVEGENATVARPKLIEAFNEIRGYGIGLDK